MVQRAPTLTHHVTDSQCEMVQCYSAMLWKGWRGGGISRESVSDMGLGRHDLLSGFLWHAVQGMQDSYRSPKL